MNELIKIENIKGIETCNARDLWIFLESKQKFADWIKNRIEKYEFIEGDGFITILGKTSEVGGRPTIEYYLSLDMAKELSMVENNEKGKQARRYFIDCEKKLKELDKETIEQKAERLYSKRVRLSLADAINETGLNEKMHGWGFKNITDLVYKTVLGCNCKKYKEIHNIGYNLRDGLSANQLKMIAHLEGVVKSLVMSALNYEEIKQLIIFQ